METTLGTAELLELIQVALAVCALGLASTLFCLGQVRKEIEVEGKPGWGSWLSYMISFVVVSFSALAGSHFYVEFVERLRLTGETYRNLRFLGNALILLLFSAIIWELRFCWSLLQVIREGKKRLL